MDQRFKKHIDSKRFKVGMAMLFLLFGIGTVLVSDFFIVPAAAFYALVLWFWNDNKLLVSVLPLVVSGMPSL